MNKKVSDSNVALFLEREEKIIPFAIKYQRAEKGGLIEIEEARDQTLQTDTYEHVWLIIHISSILQACI